MKKTIALFLALALTLSLAACSGSGVEEFKLEYSNIKDNLVDYYDDCTELSYEMYTIWYTVGADDFLMVVKSIAYFTESITLEEYSEVYNTNMDAAAYVAALGVCPDIDIPADAYGSRSQEVIDACVEFNDLYKRVLDSGDVISDEISVLSDEYGNKYESEISLLNELYIECSLYADLALNPSGSRITYGERISEYKDSIDRIILTVDTI